MWLTDKRIQEFIPTAFTIFIPDVTLWVVYWSCLFVNIFFSPDGGGLAVWLADTLITSYCVLTAYHLPQIHVLWLLSQCGSNLYIRLHTHASGLSLYCYTATRFYFALTSEYLSLPRRVKFVLFIMGTCPDVVPMNVFLSSFFMGSHMALNLVCATCNLL
jgi:hypothetical protein